MPEVTQGREDALTDLGTIEAETKGDVGFIQDTAGLRQLGMGLSED